MNQGENKPPEQLSLIDLCEEAGDASLRTEADFARDLAAAVPCPLHLTLTKNRTSLISARWGKGGAVEARIHHAFRAADEKELKWLSRFIVKPDRRSRAAVDAFIKGHADLFETLSRTDSAKNHVTRGENRDLKKIFLKVMHDHGLKALGLKITWGKRGASSRRRSIKFGSYCHRTKTVTIHPDLDRDEVPDFFVEYIVYHEVLHHLFPPAPGADGRREVHGPEFKRFEKKFIRYREAREFEKFFVRSLLR